MQTIQVEIENSVYEEMMNSGIDIQKKFKEFLLEYNFIDDGYASIGTQEAKERVGKAVEDYQNGTGTYLSQNEYEQRMDTFMKKLETQYGNN